VIKVVAYGKRYFIDTWNIFDMVIVVATVFGIILSATASSTIGPQTTIIRSFRIVRVFFFFKSNIALKNTMMTFMLSIPAMVNIGGLLTLINIVFSILGMYLFAEVMPNGELNDYTNFRTFGASFLTLIRIITGEKWPLLMEAVSRSHSPSYQCIMNPSYEDFHLNSCNII
jgi:voltage-gated sodium channel